LEPILAEYLELREAVIERGFGRFAVDYVIRRGTGFAVAQQREFFNIQFVGMVGYP